MSVLKQPQNACVYKKGLTIQKGVHLDFFKKQLIVFIFNKLTINYPLQNGGCFKSQYVKKAHFYSNMG